MAERPELLTSQDLLLAPEEKLAAANHRQVAESHPHLHPGPTGASVQRRPDCPGPPFRNTSGNGMALQVVL